MSHMMTHLSPLISPILGVHGSRFQKGFTLATLINPPKSYSHSRCDDWGQTHHNTLSRNATKGDGSYRRLESRDQVIQKATLNESSSMNSHVRLL